MKGRMKKLIFSTTFVFMLICILSFGVSALEATGRHQASDVYWNYNSDTKELVLSGSGGMAYVDYPEESPFYGEDIETVIVREGITSISNYAFHSCNNLKKIFMADTVTKIGKSAFIGTAWYNNQPDGVVYIGNVICGYKGELGDVIIKDGVVSIGQVFNYCNSLKSIVLPSTMRELDYEAFYYCDNLRKVVIPANVKVLSFGAFSGCRNLDTVEIEKGVEVIRECTFLECEKLTQITIPDSVKTIGFDAFLGCSLTEVFIPASVEVIGNEAFGYKISYADNLAGSGDKIDDFKIIGFKDSAAEKYAKDNGFKFEEYNFHSHSYISKTTKSPTCINTGTKKYICSCGDTYTKKISKLAHIYKVSTTKATLKKNGKTVTKCTVCGQVKSTTTIYYPKTIKLSAITYTYNNKTKTPSVIVKDNNGKTLKKGTDYTVTYPKKRKSIGKYTVTVTFKGNYSGTKKLTYEIVPAKVTLSKLTASSKQLAATWKTVSGATGYEVVYSTSKKFTKKTTKKVTIKKSSAKKTTVKKLKKGKKYYVKVRAYKTVSGKKIYGAYSSVKSVRVK